MSSHPIALQWLAGLAAALLSMAVVGGFADSTLFGSKPAQSECKDNLERLAAAERELFARERRYSERLADLAAPVERGNRYAYFLGSSGPLEDRGARAAVAHAGDVGVGVDAFHWHHAPLAATALPSTFAGGQHLGLEGRCPDCRITLACAGQIGQLPLDVWSISSGPRTRGGAAIAAGTPFHESGGPEPPSRWPGVLVLLWAACVVSLKALAVTSQERAHMYQQLFAFLFYGLLALASILVMTGLLLRT